jgi:ABC-type Na+ efflux pump permease subunit
MQIDKEAATRFVKHSIGANKSAAETAKEEAEKEASQFLENLQSAPSSTIDEKANSNSATSKQITNPTPTAHTSAPTSASEESNKQQPQQQKQKATPTSTVTATTVSSPTLSKKRPASVMNIDYPQASTPGSSSPSTPEAVGGANEGAKKKKKKKKSKGPGAGAGAQGTV